MGAKSRGEPKERKREIVGICLLGLAVFCVLSLISMQAGSRKMMGPGGEAAASGLYSLAGFGAYLITGAMLVIAVRCFRGRSVIQGIAEVTGLLGLLASLAVLLHLPFADGAVALRGPGGLLGQWLGQIVASFIGSVGAGLAAVTMLAVSVLLITDVSFGEAALVIGWAARHTGRAILAGARALARVLVAMFPEKVEGERDHDEDGDLSVDEDEPQEPVRALSKREKTLLGVAPVPLRAIGDDESDAVVVGRPQAAIEEDEAADERQRPMSTAEQERRAMAALVAEVAAVECAVAQEADADDEDQDGPATTDDAEDDRPVVMASARPDAPTISEPLRPELVKKEQPAPIIVEPLFRAHLRQKEDAAAAAAAAEKDASDGRGFIQLSDGAFQLPGTQMLSYEPPKGGETDKQGLYEMAERLEQAMSNYGVRGKVKEIHMGPVVTMFEFAPAPGTRTGKIAQLENDLAMALEAQAVRIVAPIPGKAVVGVEVPNKHREMVYLKEMLDDESFSRGGMKLQVSLGKDIKGAPVSVNLAKMPHLLVAGTTGSGKSVAVNGMITSILFNASPEEVRFIMVDPKMLELSIYEGIPHLLLPVVTDPKKANLALRWAVDEMERRYELLAKSGVRDILSYNAKLEVEEAKRSGAANAAKAAAPSKKRKLKVVIAGEDGVEREVEVDAEAEEAEQASTGGGAPIPAEELAEEESDRAAKAQFSAQNPEQAPRKLPYIVIVIDEFADLMMVAPKDVETSVARIAQKARAAGLHLILATQRPSVDVITGLIKANFPSRIALQVASKIDSRTILDQPGAETLLGNGDMLFSDRGTKLRRIHGAFLSDDEVHRVVDFLKTQAKPVYDMDILKPRDEESEDGEGAPREEFHDDLYDQAVAIVCDTRQASVSYIQRRLQIGYNRSARMVEQMEREGLVGPANGIKPREVLAPTGEYLTAAP